MTVPYTVSIDFNDDGDWSDVGESLNADVIGIHWKMGMQQPYDTVAAPGEAIITLRNISKNYSPEVTAGLAPGLRLRITGFYISTDVVKFTGMIVAIEPQAGTESERISIIRAATSEAQLKEAKVRIAPLSNVTADTAISAILNEVPLRDTLNFGGTPAAILDLVGHAELDSVTLAVENFGETLDVGNTTFDYVGDTFVDGITAYEAIRQLVDAEQGRFFFSEAGDATFFNRGTVLTNGAGGGTITIDDDARVVEYAYGKGIKNRVELTMTPRHVGTAASVLWQSSASQRLEANSSRQVVVHYRDSNKKPAGALLVLPLIPGTDFTANTASDGSGSNVTSQVGVLLLKSDFSAATLNLVNQTGAVAYIQSGMTVKGTPLYRDDPQTVIETDYTSETLYGLGCLEYNLPALTSLDQANQFALYASRLRSEPRGMIRRVKVDHVDQDAHMVNAQLFTSITVNDAQTGQSGNYFIVAVEHDISEGGLQHTAYWLLEPTSDGRFARLDYSYLDEGYVLAY